MRRLRCSLCPGCLRRAGRQPVLRVAAPVVYAQPVAPARSAIAAAAAAGPSFTIAVGRADPDRGFADLRRQPGPGFSGPGITVPYRTYSPAPAYAPPYPYVPGYGPHRYYPASPMRVPTCTRTASVHASALLWPGARGAGTAIRVSRSAFANASDILAARSAKACLARAFVVCYALSLRARFAM